MWNNTKGWLELSFFLGLKISQTPKGIFISQSKYLKELLKSFGMDECALVGTPMTMSCKLKKYDDWQSIIFNCFKT